MTLLELLLALVISTILLGTAFATYRTSMRAWETCRSRSLTTQYARAALDRMEGAIQAAVPPNSEKGIVFEGTSGVIEGTELSADRLRLTTTGMRVLPDRPGSSDLAELQFYLDINERLGEPALLVRAKPFPSSDPALDWRTDELAPRVASFNVRYFDGTEFLDEWDSDSLPRAVRIDLLLYDFSAEENAVQFKRLIEVRTR